MADERVEDRDLLDPQEWWEEIDAGEKFAEQHRSTLTELQRQCSGSDVPVGGRDTMPGEPVDFESVAFGMMAWLSPQLVWDDARVDMESPIDPEETRAIQDAENAWIVSSRFRETLVPLVQDYTLCWGVATTQLANDPLLGRALKARGVPIQDDPQWPVVRRIPQERYFIDPGAIERRSAMFEGHGWTRMFDEIAEEAKENPQAGWDMDAVKDCIVEDDDSPELEGRFTPSRQLVRGYQLFVPGLVLSDSKGPDEGYNGTLLTLAKDPGGAAAFLRPPQPFYGPPEGCYSFIGMYPVANTPFATSSLVTTMPAIRELNALQRTIQESAKKFKQGVIFDAKDDKVRQEVQAAPDWALLGIRNLFQAGKPAFAPYKVGGAAPEQFVQRDDIRNLVQTQLGYTDRQAGNDATDSTATASAIAQANADVRLQWIRSQWVAGVTSMLRKVAWYLAVNDRAYVPLSGRSMGLAPGQTAIYQGGQITPAEFERLHLRIAPYSMERTDEGTRGRRALEAFQLMLQIPQMLTTVPGMGFMPWEEIIDWLGDSLNMPELRRFLPPEAIALMSQAAMAAPPAGGTSPTLGGSTPPRPSPARRPPPNEGGPGQQAGAQATENFRPMGAA